MERKVTKSQLFTTTVNLPGYIGITTFEVSRQDTSDGPKVTLKIGDAIPVVHTVSYPYARKDTISELFVARPISEYARLKPISFRPFRGERPSSDDEKEIFGEERALNVIAFDEKLPEEYRPLNTVWFPSVQITGEVTGDKEDLRMGALFINQDGVVRICIEGPVSDRYGFKALKFTFGAGKPCDGQTAVTPVPVPVLVPMPGSDIDDWSPAFGRRGGIVRPVQPPTYRVDPIPCSSDSIASIIVRCEHLENLAAEHARKIQALLEAPKDKPIDLESAKPDGANAMAREHAARTALNEIKEENKMLREANAGVITHLATRQAALEDENETLRAAIAVSDLGRTEDKKETAYLRKLIAALAMEFEQFKGQHAHTSNRVTHIETALDEASCAIKESG